MVVFMFKLIDDFLNGITMYRLMLYFLIVLVTWAIVLSFLHFLPFNPLTLVFSATFLTLVCWVTNKFLSKVFKAPTNLESVYITALILTLIITPMHSFSDLGIFIWVAVWSQASKYIFAIKKKHLFNPAAFAVTLSALVLYKGASWWVGTTWMAPLLAVGGLLIARKIQKSALVSSFFVMVAMVVLGTSILRGGNLFLTIQNTLLETPLLFFAFVMLTEPATTPPTKKLQIIYGFFVGLLFAQPFNLSFLNTSVEMALLVGNIFSYLVSPKEKLFLRLKEKIRIADNIYDFIFNFERNLKFLPGQYMEWTLSHKNPDNRGVRRYFTIAASPTERNLRIGVKFYPQGSSFKKALLAFGKGDQIVASQLAGEFTLPKEESRKLVFITGGIGITPFRSMVKYLGDKNQKRDIVVLISNKSVSEIVYKDIFKEAVRLGIKTVYVLTDSANIPLNWKGKVGHINAQLIKEEIPDYQDRIFYISGPHSMVVAFEETLKEMGIVSKQIKVDFFPGYA